MAVGWSSVEVGIGWWGGGLSGTTLGSVSGGRIRRCNVGVFTLGGGVTGCAGMVDMGSILLICVAIVYSVLGTGSSACKEGVVVEGGEASMVIMSVAACFKKSSILTSGKGTVVGKNVTVSNVLIILVRGK